MLNTLILQYDYKIDTRDNLLKFSKENDMNYIFNILDLFYNNREIDNLGNFFRKNSLYSSGSTTNLREEYFKSKINELDYTNLVSIINDTRLDYYLDRYLNSNRIKFSHIFDNKIIFNLQTYIDIQKIRRDNIIDLQTLNILKSNFPT